MNTLITGGAGFIGSNYVRYLYSNTEDQITVVDNLNYRGCLENFPLDIWNSPRFKFVYGDICNERLMIKLLGEAEQVVNFAAWSFVDKSFDNSADFIKSDIEGVRCLMEALRLSDTVEKFIHISTSEVYGTALTRPMTEDHPLDPCSIYAASKCGGDRLAKAYWITHGLPVVIIRPFNNYGPNQYIENWIPKVITSILSGRPIPLFGEGTAKRDWLYVKDTCRGISKALDRGKPGEVYNLATGESTSTYTVALKVTKFLQDHVYRIDNIAARPGEVSEHIGSYEKATNELGWSPKYTFEMGLEETVEWFISNKQWWQRRSVDA